MRAIILAAIIIAIFGAGPVHAGQILLQGRIVDTQERPVSGAELFVYDSSKTRRQADFISPRTGADGKFSLKLPAGQYWVVARVRQGEKYGPLLPGDLHSGEPQEIDLSAEVKDLTLKVADIRELNRAKEKTSSAIARLTGRITDRNGRPLEGFYVCAWRSPISDRLPDLFSGWTDSTGEYQLFLPPGEYRLLTTALSPPPTAAGNFSSVTVHANEKSVAYNFQITTMDQESSPEQVHHASDELPLADE